MNVFGYLRVSGQAQIDGDGFPRQAEAVRAFCTHFNLKFSGFFHEEGVSGTVDGLDRPAFSDLLSQIETPNDPANPITAIVVERMDRLARDLMVSELLLAECRKRNIKVYSADQGALIDMASDGGDPTRVLIRQIMGALAQWEKSNLVKKLRAARDRVRAKQGWCEGPKPFGRTPAELQLLATIFELREGGMSLSRMASFLNESGVVNINSRDGTWSKTVIANFLNRHSKRMQNARIRS